MTKLKENITKAIAWLQGYANRFWYAPLLSFLAVIDNIILVLPIDGILISSTILKPKRWFYFAFMISIGSTLGALVLSYVTKEYGLPTLLQFYPDLDKTTYWSRALDFFQMYGLLFVFIVSISPFMQQPAVVIASLAATPYLKLILVIFLGRFIKYIIFAYIGSHMPRLLTKLWGFDKSELTDAGVKIP